MSQCVVWAKATNALGYGILKHAGKSILAHRKAYADYHGLDVHTMGGVVMHTCDNPPCTNPDHLVMGTHKINSDDKVAKGRAYHPSGDAHPRARLTAALVQEIRHTYISRHPEFGDAARARQFGVATAVIRAARVGKTWRTA